MRAVKKRQTLDLLKQGYAFIEAAAMVGITTATVRNWRDHDQDFGEKVLQIIEEGAASTGKGE